MGQKLPYCVSDLAFTHEGLFLSDLRQGFVGLLQFNGGLVEAHPVAQLSNPAHVERCEIDGDGQAEYLAAELGSLSPADHADGHVLLITPPRGTEKLRIDSLLSGVGRVADCRCADFTGDGSADILVAEFGWRKTGSIHLLVQKPNRGRPPVFEKLLIDQRHGASHVPLVDLDDDGDTDFIALVSQEHETIVAYVNQGEGRFEQHVVFEACDPDFGSSCIWLSDIDGDQDVDVVYSNGDSLDANILKPWHGIHWIENLGNLDFQYHHLTDLPGAMGVAAADMDGDGDQDIIACAITLKRESTFTNLVLLEQEEAGQFRRHNLDNSPAQHAAIEVGDFDQDGDIDLAVGEWEERNLAVDSALTIWWNQGSNPDRSSN